MTAPFLAHSGWGYTIARCRTFWLQGHRPSSDFCQGTSHGPHDVAFEPLVLNMSIQATLDTADKTGRTPLSIAAGQVHNAMHVIDEGLGIDTLGRSQGHDSFAKLLIENEADANMVSQRIRRENVKILSMSIAPFVDNVADESHFVHLGRYHPKDSFRLCEDERPSGVSASSLCVLSIIFTDVWASRPLYRVHCEIACVYCLNGSRLA